MSIITQIIVNKFPSEYALARRTAGDPGGGQARRAIARNKQNAFLKRYDTDEAFREKMNSSYAYKKQDYFDFLLIFDELREFLREDLESAEVLLIEEGRVSALSLKQLERAVSEVSGVEEFKQLVLEEQAQKLNIWFELERRLESVFL